MSNLFRDNLYNEFPDPNKKISELGDNLEYTSAKLDGLGINVLRPPRGLTALKNDYDYITQTGTDNTEALQSLIDYASTLGLELIFPPGKYLIIGDVTVKAGVHLKGVYPGSKKEAAPNRDFKGTTLIIRGAQFKLNDSVIIDGFNILYDQQKYRLSYDSAKPDGIEDFISYPATFQPNGSGSFTIRNINYFGGSIFVEQVDGDASQRFEINTVHGVATKVGVHIKNALDISHITDVRFNCTMNRGIAVGDYLPGQPNQAFYNKLAKNFTGFKLGRVDGIVVTRCFVFGGRDFAWLYSTSEGGCGAEFVACYGDVIHNGFRIEGGSNPFGVKVIGGSFTPITYKPLYDGDLSVSDETPALLRLSATASGQRIQFSNVSTFGATNSVFDRDINKCVTPYQLAGSTNVNTVLVSNCFHYDYTGAELVSGCNSTNLFHAEQVRGAGGRVFSKTFGQPWLDFSLVNGTQPYDTPPLARYKMDRYGVVTIQMRIKNMTLGSPVAYLPAEMRSDHNINFNAYTGGAATSFAKGFIDKNDGAINITVSTSPTDAQTLTSIELSYKLP